MDISRYDTPCGSIAGRNVLIAPYIQPAITPVATRTSMFILRFLSEKYAPLIMLKPAIHTIGVETMKIAKP